MLVGEPNAALQAVVNNAVADLDSQNGMGAKPDASLPAISRVPVSSLNITHPEYEMFEKVWNDIEILTSGGQMMRVHARRFLTQRPKEIGDIYTARVESITYSDPVGHGIGYYVSSLFKEDPTVDVMEAGKTLDADETKDSYYGEFLRDADRAGTPLAEIGKRLFRDLLVSKKFYCLIDLPTEVAQAESLGDQRVEPYLCVFGARNAINWATDVAGNLQWIVFRSHETITQFMAAAVTCTRWSYYDKQEYRIFERRSDEKRQIGDVEDMAREVQRGRHAMTDFTDEFGNATGRVPVVTAELSDLLWICNRVYLQLLEHFNLENTLKWGLLMGNLLMPVIKTQGEYTPQLHEAGAIKLLPGDEFGFAEPEGTTFKLTMERLEKLREEIYRGMYLQAMGRSSAATPGMQSGYSKELDMAPAEEVLNAFGTIMRRTLETILYLIRDIRQDSTMDFDVRGLKSNTDPVLDDIVATQQVLALEIQSDKFHKEVQKALIRIVGRAWNQGTVTECCSEVDSAPTASEIKEADENKQDDQFNAQLAAKMSKIQPPKNRPAGSDI